MREQGAVAFGVIWLLFVGLLAYGLVRSVADQVDAATFVPVPATVVASEVRTSSNGTAGSSTRTFDPHITYRYSVRDDLLTSDRYHFAGLSTWTEASAEDVVRTHPPGTQIVAYVDPAEPTRVVLDPSPPPLVPLALLLTLLGSAGLGLMVWGVRGMRREPVERAEPATSP